MKNLNYVLACLILSQSTAWAAPRSVVCQGSVKVLGMNNKTTDSGVARVRFQLVDELTIRHVRVQSKFKKTKAQKMETFESRAYQRAVASGKFQADLFPLGSNGACQLAFGYQGKLARSTGTRSSWSVLGMNCGNYAVTGNLKCQMK